MDFEESKDKNKNFKRYLILNEFKLNVILKALKILFRTKKLH